MGMGRRSLLAGAAAAAAMAASGAKSATCGVVPEMPMPGLPDIAFATWNFSHQNPQFGGYSGPLIYHNPGLAQRIGPALTSFFQAHEYGHVCLSHVQEHYFTVDPWARRWMSLPLELQADSFAVRRMIGRGNLEAVRAAFRWFNGMGPVDVVPTHPPNQVRAQNLLVTAERRGFDL